MLIVVCPGQGAQTPGFLAPWLEIPTLRALLEQYSDIAGIDLIRHGTTSDAETIRDTAIAQPLLVAAGMLTSAALFKDGIPKHIGTAGHSVGEITAGQLAGVLSPEDAMRFVRERSLSMAKAAALEPSGMSAILGGNEDAVLARLADLDLTAANFNGGGQIVAAGSIANLQRLTDEPPSGSRVIPLKVAGAFHSQYMRSAVEHLAATAKGIAPHNPVIPIWSNFDGSQITTGDSFLSRLVGQVSSPVHWDLCMKSFADVGVSGIVELAPGGTLSGLARRALKGTPTVAIKTPEDLPAALDLIEAA